MIKTEIYGGDETTILECYLEHYLIRSDQYLGTYVSRVTFVLQKVFQYDRTQTIQHERSDFYHSSVGQLTLRKLPSPFVA